MTALMSDTDPRCAVCDRASCPGVIGRPCVNSRELDVGLLRMAVESLSQFLPAWLEEIDGELPALYALADVREARQALAQVEAELEREAAKRMGSEPVEQPDLYAVKRKSKDRKEWRWDDLVRSVVSPVAVDPGTGEVQPGAFEAAHELQECIGFSYARVGALKARGLAADEFCTSVPGRVSVTVSRTPLDGAE